MSVSDPLLGRVIAERYRVLGPLGKGGMGAVYRVEHISLKKEMALKLLPPELSGHDEMVKRFEREAEAAARLDHLNIIRVTDFGRTEEGTFYLAMELITGKLLADVMQPGGDGTPNVKIAPARAIHIVEQVARALEHAHAVGVIHRDLKPQNIMLVERGDAHDIVKLLDFGIAKLLQMDSGSSEALTQAGLVYGTPEYLSPEQAVGDMIDPRADLYSLGVILFEMLAGRLPFESPSKLEILHKHVHEAAPSLLVVAPRVPDDLAVLTARLLRKHREDRIASAAALVAELERVDPTPSLPPGSLPKGAVARATTLSMRTATRYMRRTIRTLRFGTSQERLRAMVPVPIAVLLLLLVSSAFRHRPATPPTTTTVTDPGIAQMTEPQKFAMVEALLGSGQLAAARAALQQILSSHPESARAHFLFGNVNYVEGERVRALGDYLRAVELDPTLAAEPVLNSNVKASLDRKAEVPAAIELYEKGFRQKGVDELRACQKSCRLETARRRAQEALDRMAPPDAAATPTAAPMPSTPTTTSIATSDGTDVVVDTGNDTHVADLDKLRKGRACKDRKAAALQLIATHDKRYASALRTARLRKGGFFGTEEINSCMRAELDAALRAFDEPGH